MDFDICTGIDLRMQWLDSRTLRVTVYGLLYGFVSLVLFFCYAIMSDKTGGSAQGLIAFGYFVALLVISLYMLMQICPIPMMKKLDVATVGLLYFVTMFISVLFIMIGYWAMAAESGISEFSAYWVGFSFFTTLMGVQLAFDFRRKDVQMQFENVKDESH